MAIHNWTIIQYKSYFLLNNYVGVLFSLLVFDILVLYFPPFNRFCHMEQDNLGIQPFPFPIGLTGF